MSVRRASYLLLLLVMASSQTLAQEEYVERMQFADGLHSRGMHELAVAEYEGLLVDYPDGASNDAVRFRLAESLRQTGKSSAAAKVYEKIIVAHRQSVFRLRAAYRRARIYMEAENHEAATEHFRAILSANVSEDLGAACRFYLGESLIAMDRATEAEAAYARLITDYVGSMFAGLAQLRIADIRRDLWRNNKPGQADAALDAYRKALKANASDRVSAESLFQMAEIYFAQEDYDRASEHYHRLMREFPSDERSLEARMQAAWAACNAGLYADAVTLAETALSGGETDARPEWLYLKANGERQLLQNDAAAATYTRLIELYPNSRFAGAARYELALAYYKAGDYDDAIREAVQIRADETIRADLFWLLAESYAALNRSREAIQYYRKIVSDDPESALARDAAYRLGHHLQKSGEFREAARFYNRVVTQFPQHEETPKALFAGATCLAASNEHEGAIRDWGRLVKEWETSALVEESLYHKGISEVRISRADDALTSFGELVRRFPESRLAGDANYWRGMLLKEAGKLSDAAKALTQAKADSSREELSRDATFNLGLVLQKQGKHREAAALFESLLASPIKGKFPPALLEWLSVQHYEQNEFDKAAEAARQLAAGAEEKLWEQAAWCLLGRALLAQKNTAGAEEAFGKALAVTATTDYRAEAALRLGEIAATHEDYEKAESLLREAARLAPAGSDGAIRVRAFFALGSVAEKAGNLEDASRHYMSVAILYDDNELVPQALRMASAIFKRRGMSDESDQALAELKERYPNQAE